MFSTGYLSCVLEIVFDTTSVQWVTYPQYEVAVLCSSSYKISDSYQISYATFTYISLSCKFTQGGTDIMLVNYKYAYINGMPIVLQVFFNVELAGPLCPVDVKPIRHSCFWNTAGTNTGVSFTSLHHHLLQIIATHCHCRVRFPWRKANVTLSMILPAELSLDAKLKIFIQYNNVNLFNVAFGRTLMYWLQWNIVVDLLVFNLFTHFNLRVGD